MENWIQEGMLQTLFPETVVVEAMDSEGRWGDLYSQEQIFLQHATGKRRGEFAAGRLCARKALQRLGVTEAPISADEKGAPIWPIGFVGSISHTKGYYAAAVAKKEDVEAIGLDVEKADRLQTPLWNRVLKVSEIAWLEKTIPQSMQVTWATLFFSAKEAFYKFQYPITGCWLGFQDVRIKFNEINTESGSFTVYVEKSDYPREKVLKGQYIFFGPYVATALYLSTGRNHSVKKEM